MCCPHLPPFGSGISRAPEAHRHQLPLPHAGRRLGHRPCVALLVGVAVADVELTREAVNLVQDWQGALLAAAGHGWALVRGLDFALVRAELASGRASRPDVLGWSR
jgi:hypothetical protein